METLLHKQKISSPLSLVVDKNSTEVNLDIVTSFINELTIVETIQEPKTLLEDWKQFTNATMNSMHDKISF